MANGSEDFAPVPYLLLVWRRPFQHYLEDKSALIKEESVNYPFSC